MLARLGNHWAECGEHVTLITFASVDRDAFPVDPRVTRIAIDVMGESRSLIARAFNTMRRIRRLRRAIYLSRPDCVVAFTQIINVLCRLAVIGLGVSVVATERTDPRHHPVSGSLKQLMRWTYPRCHTVVAQTRGVADYFSSFVPRDRIRVIPNGVEKRASPVALAGDPKWIAAMGRLSPEKGFLPLLEAFASIQENHPEWRLRIIGEGTQREQLEAKARQLDIAEAVELAGWSQTPESLLSECSLFVLPSRYEGFPNALLEAMAMGLPAVSFDCESGPADIIRHDEDGLLIPDQDWPEFTKAMERLIQDDAARLRMGNKAVEAAERFSMRTFLDAWDGVVTAAISAGA